MKRRTMLIVLIVVALSVGIVFSSVPYLSSPPPPHASITVTKSYFIGGGGNQSRPKYSEFTIQGVLSSQAFWVNATVTNGTASFCVLSPTSYNAWVSNYNQPGSARDRLTGCILGPTQEFTQDTLKFQTPYSGDWVVLALNTNPTDIMVQYSPA